MVQGVQGSSLSGIKQKSSNDDGDEEKIEMKEDQNDESRDEGS